jgi:hypothetical protein
MFDPSEGHMFEISNGEDTVYADDAEAAFVAYHQLHRDRGIMGTNVSIRNLVTGRIICVS